MRPRVFEYTIEYRCVECKQIYTATSPIEHETIVIKPCMRDADGSFKGFIKGLLFKPCCLGELVESKATPKPL